jgi:hypothetical protein
MKTLIPLYRYLPADAAIKTIESGCFRVGRIAELNDPFEWSFGFDGSRPEKIADDRREREEMIQQFNEKWGVLCFCEVFKDPAMWSHYADRHRGVVIEIKANVHDDAYHKILYSRRPIIQQHWLDDREKHAQELKGAFDELFRCKAPSWKCEREWRAVIRLDKCSMAEGMFLWKIPDNLITRLIIGIRSQVSPYDLRRSLDAHGFKGVQVVKAMESLKNYEVVC